MADIDWKSYIGMATGVFGAVLSGISYRKSNSVVRTQMRLDLKKKHSDLGSLIQNAKESIESAIGSKRNIDAATGRLGTGGINNGSKKRKVLGVGFKV